MSVLCVGGTHVYLVGHTRCTCGAVASSVPANPYPLSGGVIPGYTPANYAPKPTAGEAPKVSIKVFRLAQLAGASHLSMDGKLIYCERFGEILVAEWDGEKFGRSKSAYGVW